MKRWDSNADRSHTSCQNNISSCHRLQQAPYGMLIVILSDFFEESVHNGHMLGRRTQQSEVPKQNPLVSPYTHMKDVIDPSSGYDHVHMCHNGPQSELSTTLACLPIYAESDSIAGQDLTQEASSKHHRGLAAPLKGCSCLQLFAGRAFQRVSSFNAAAAKVLPFREGRRLQETWPTVRRSPGFSPWRQSQPFWALLIDLSRRRDTEIESQQWNTAHMTRLAPLMRLPAQITGRGGEVRQKETSMPS